jgi:hypothetical protein
VIFLEKTFAYAKMNEITPYRRHFVAEIKFEIVKRIGVLSTSSKGWTKELNLVSWNDREPKFDIREWSPDGMTMGKGVTLTEEELDALRKLLEQMES